MAYGLPKPAAAGGKPAGHPLGAKPAPFVPFVPGTEEVAPLVGCAAGGGGALALACLPSAGANVWVDMLSGRSEDERRGVVAVTVTAVCTAMIQVVVSENVCRRGKFLRACAKPRGSLFREREKRTRGS